MRYSTGINVTRKSPPQVTIIEPPNPDYPAEVRVDFGGLHGWFSEAEATALGRDLIEAGIRLRTDRQNRSGEPPYEPQGDASDVQALEAFLRKLAGDGAYALDFSSADALHGHIVHLLKRDIAALRAGGAR